MRAAQQYWNVDARLADRPDLFGLADLLYNACPESRDDATGQSVYRVSTHCLDFLITATWFDGVPSIASVTIEPN